LLLCDVCLTVRGKPDLHRDGTSVLQRSTLVRDNRSVWEDLDIGDGVCYEFERSFSLDLSKPNAKANMNPIAETEMAASIAVHVDHFAMWELGLVSISGVRKQFDLGIRRNPEARA